jgi:hypothetical protein
VTIYHIDPMCFLSLSSSYISMHALILLPKPRTLGIGCVHGTLSPAVMRVVQVFHPLCC